MWLCVAKRVDGWRLVGCAACSAADGQPRRAVGAQTGSSDSTGAVLLLLLLLLLLLFVFSFVFVFFFFFFFCCCLFFFCFFLIFFVFPLGRGTDYMDSPLHNPTANFCILRCVCVCVCCNLACAHFSSAAGERKNGVLDGQPKDRVGAPWPSAVKDAEGTHAPTDRKRTPLLDTCIAYFVLAASRASMEYVASRCPAAPLQQLTRCPVIPARVVGWGLTASVS